MFEHYTQTARQLILDARTEAIQYGAPVIETPHLLLALLQEDNSVLRRLLPAGAAATIANEVRETTPHSNPASQRNHGSLSPELKRILTYGAEAAERLREPEIDSVHCLLGLFSEENCPALACSKSMGSLERQSCAKSACRIGRCGTVRLPHQTRETRVSIRQHAWNSRE